MRCILAIGHVRVVENIRDVRERPDDFGKESGRREKDMFIIVYRFFREAIPKTRLLRGFGLGERIEMEEERWRISKADQDRRTRWIEFDLLDVMS